MPKTNQYASIGAAIKTLRECAGLTQRELAEALKCSVPQLSNIETGHRCISFDLFIRCTRVLNLSPDDLLASSNQSTLDPYVAAISVRLRDCTKEEKRLFLELLRICKQLMKRT